MNRLELKNKKNIIIVEEDCIPNICGFIKGEDLALSLSIKVYKNNKGKEGKLVSSYSKIWFDSCTDKDFNNFLLNFFKDISYREEHRLSSNSWVDEYIVSKEEIYLINTFTKENKDAISYPLKKEKVKAIKPTSKSKYYNASVKNGAINLLITDNEINALSEVFSDKNNLVLAICEILKGKSVEEILKEEKIKELVTA